MDYGEVLGRSWRIVWKHKILWLFGFFASCGQQGGSTGGQGANYQFDSRDFQDMSPGMRDFFFGLERAFGDIPEETWLVVALGIICLGLLLALVFFVLTTFGRVGMIKGTMQADGGAATLTLGGLFADLMPFMGRALGLNLLIGVVALVLGLIFAGFAFAMAISLIGIACLVPLICLLIPIAWLIGIFVEQANVALVVEDIGVFEALEKAWEVVRGNFGEFVVMGLILIIGYAVASFVIGLPLLLVLGPALIGVLGGMQGSDQALVGGLGVAALCFVLYLPVLLLVNGIVRAYYESAWTLTYLRLTGRGPAEAEAEALPAAA